MIEQDRTLGARARLSRAVRRWRWGLVLLIVKVTDPAIWRKGLDTAAYIVVALAIVILLLNNYGEGFSRADLRLFHENPSP